MKGARWQDILVGAVTIGIATGLAFPDRTTSLIVNACIFISWIVLLQAIARRGV